VLFDLPEGVSAAHDSVGNLRSAAGCAPADSTYKTKKKDEAEREGLMEVVVALADPDSHSAAMSDGGHLADAVMLARTLVNEPANVLTPPEFARRASELMKLGVEVEVLDEKAMSELGMQALLGVGRGLRRHPARRAALERRRRRRSNRRRQGVVFDSNGISIKPAPRWRT
jgi:leucyl aminopeptidase